MRPARVIAAVVALDALPLGNAHQRDVTAGAAGRRGGVLLGGHLPNLMPPNLAICFFSDAIFLMRIASAARMAPSSVS